MKLERLTMLETLLLMILFGLFTAVQGFDNSTDEIDETFVDDVEKFPVCMTHEDCEDITTRAGTEYQCFQYRCFPWKDTNYQGTFRRCKDHVDCAQLEVEAGGDGDDGKCFRHQDKRRISFGVCLKESSNKRCQEHKDCDDNLKCVNGNCGEDSYLQALNTFKCVDHDYCEGLLLGNRCCYDFTPEDPNQLDKTCCNAEGSAGVVIPEEIHEDTFAQIDTKVGFIAEEEKEDVCMAFSEEILSKIANCQPLTTAEPTPVVEVITTSTTTLVQTTTEELTTVFPVEEITEPEDATQDDAKVAEVMANNNAGAVFNIPFILMCLCLAL